MRHDRVLVVDDDENISKVLATILEDNGYTVETAGSGSEAIMKTQQSYFNVMLVDIRLPDIEGTELLTRVRDTTPRIRKIIVTGYPTLQNAITAVNRGADAYVIKPFDVDRLLETIRQQLEKQSLEQKFNQEKVADFIETRIKEIEAGETRIA